MHIRGSAGVIDGQWVDGPTKGGGDRSISLDAGTVALLHDLRHVHATTLLLEQVPVHVVAARLGHAGPAITLRVHAHALTRTDDCVAELSPGTTR